MSRANTICMSQYKAQNRNPSTNVQGRCSFFDFFFVVLELELGAFTLSHSTSPFVVMGFFEIGSSELFAQAGFKPRSS
jgi:hypothetical protein